MSGELGTLAAVGTALGLAKLVEKVFGPTAGYLGAGMEGWAERKVNNLRRIIENAGRMLGDDLERPGSVPPKVLKGILEEGAFCEDELAAEYFGGVLASSRTVVSRDDRGASLVCLIGRLTSYQIRSHYFFYRAVKALYDGSTNNVQEQDGRSALMTYVPLSTYLSVLELGASEDVKAIVPHVMFGLWREALIGENFVYGTVRELHKYYPGADQTGIVFEPSAYGVELFLWAHRRGHSLTNEFLKQELKILSELSLGSMSGVRSVCLPDKRIEVAATTVP